jgi:hypothetical protein
MKREIKKYLYDIKTSIDSIDEYLGGKRDFFEYQCVEADKVTVVLKATPRRIRPGRLRQAKTNDSSYLYRQTKNKY